MRIITPFGRPMLCVQVRRWVYGFNEYETFPAIIGLDHIVAIEVHELRTSTANPYSEGTRTAVHIVTTGQDMDDSGKLMPRVFDVAGDDIARLAQVAEPGTEEPS